MRRRALIASAAVVVAGAVVGAVVALAVRWWSLRGHGADFAWYAYSPLSGPRRYVDYLPDPVTVHWWAVLLPPAVAGAAIALLVVLVLRLAGRRLAVVRIAGAQR